MKKFFIFLTCLIAILSAMSLCACSNGAKSYDSYMYRSSYSTADEDLCVYKSVSVFYAENVEDGYKKLCDLCKTQLKGSVVSYTSYEYSEGVETLYVTFAIPEDKYDSFKEGIDGIDNMELNSHRVEKYAENKVKVDDTDRKTFLTERKKTLEETYLDTNTSGEAQAEILKEISGIENELLELNATIKADEEAGKTFMAEISIYKEYVPDTNFDGVAAVVITLLFLAFIVVIILLSVKLAKCKRDLKLLNK